MCRWGCETTNTTFMCKWCGTWFCRECKRGAYQGVGKEELQCRVCNQKRCQGTKVDFLIRQPNADDENDKNKRGKSAGGARGRSASPSKSAKGGKKGGSGKKAGGKKSGKKGGKKKKKRKK